MTLQKPLVSVVTPTLNQAEYLEDTLRSVADQTYRHVEHIVIDGGSTDGTLEILRRWEESHGVVWRSERDGGMYEAVNKGLALARGDVLSYLNSDDQWFPWTVNTAVSALARQPGAGYVYGDVVNFDDAAGDGTVVLYPPVPWPELRRSGGLGQPAVLWTREAFVEVGPFDERLRLAADTDYWIRIACRFDGARVDEVLAWEREYPTRSSQALGQRLGEELERVRAAHARRDAGNDRRSRTVDRARAALRHRAAVARLLHASISDRDDGPWSNFLCHSRFRVERSALARSTLPVVGRRHVRYVTLRTS